MLRPFGLLFHDLQGQLTYGVSRIDVASIIQMKCRQRPFMIRDRDKPYSLSILYFELPEDIQVVNQTTNLTQAINLRYPSELSAAFEMHEIQNKQKALDDYVARIREEIKKDTEKISANLENNH